MSKLIVASLDALKKTMQNNIPFQIQRNLGYYLKCSFSFSKSANSKEIEDFESETNLKLPEDYKFFLSLHNGMELYKDVEESAPHWHIFGIDEILDALEKYPTPEHVYTIAKFDQTLICVNSDYVKDGKKGYLLDQSIYTSSHNDGDPLHLNFELWLDRLLVSQGDHFWLWNSITPENLNDYFS
ncbi:hypothetical protein QW71_26530 [Paenibacillus sp. IHB B 3415]|uniref:SMI1/KNR4 family protein n=1 Tax=Paenibacillus sp. IHB B 3415 TaxID=867080 RepID=UPI000575B4F2|nr:SMI1/KNR4 family protein [Paenibacillus sp. IHB B 3415]KHL92947.1 hypothetical protein QW71_26530 [Paenibacillus sp. IHB B 3415]